MVADDRGAAAAELDGRAGNWRTLLERFAEDHAPVYLRRDAAVTTALRRLAAAGVRVGVFTDAPVELATVALAHLGAARRVEALAAGDDALARVLGEIGADAIVIRSRQELLDLG